MSARFRLLGSTAVAPLALDQLQRAVSLDGVRQNAPGGAGGKRRGRAGWSQHREAGLVFTGGVGDSGCEIDVVQASELTLESFERDYLSRCVPLSVLMMVTITVMMVMVAMITMTIRTQPRHMAAADPSATAGCSQPAAGPDQGRGGWLGPPARRPATAARSVPVVTEAGRQAAQDCQAALDGPGAVRRNLRQPTGRRWADHPLAILRRSAVQRFLRCDSSAQDQNDGGLTRARAAGQGVLRAARSF